jgi:Zn-dependent protease/CBS domain-containing protein
MPVRPTFQLARIFGIRIGVGVSWFLVLFLYIFLFTRYSHALLPRVSTTTTYVVAVATVLSFFLSLILHELGHAIVARRNGLNVLGIELWALGGMTRTTGAPTGPGAQFRVAAAGPAATLGVIAASLTAGALFPGQDNFVTVLGAESVHTTPVVLWLSILLAMNVLVLAVNMIPAFPLDGSQIAQAIFWRLTGDRNGAARITGRIGQGCAVVLGATGILVFARIGPFREVEPLLGVFLLLLAVFLYQGGGAAVLQGAVGQRIQRLKVADIMDTEPEVIPGDLRLLDAQEQFFTHRRRPWFAVVDQARHFLGVVRSERLDAEIAAGRPALSVSDVVEGESDLPMLITEDEPLEALLRSEALGRWGGVVAVDGDGVLRGVVTLAQIRKALRLASGR